jgi:DnaK suppressor protein
MTEDQAREKLKSRLAEIIEQDRISEESRGPVTLQQDSVGRLSRMDAMQQQQMALAAEQRRHAEQARIKAALARLDEGEWGYCLSCGEDVAEARLEHDPSVSQCIKCAGKSEAG